MVGAHLELSLLQVVPLGRWTGYEIGPRVGPQEPAALLGVVTMVAESGELQQAQEDLASIVHLELYEVVFEDAAAT